VFFFGDPCANRDYINVTLVANLCGVSEGFVERGIA
jgi:hypothetical protein